MPTIFLFFSYVRNIVTSLALERTFVLYHHCQKRCPWARI